MTKALIPYGLLSLSRFNKQFNLFYVFFFVCIIVPTSKCFDKCQSNQPSWGERMECGSVWLDAKRTDIDLNRFIQNNSFSFSFKTNVEDVIVDSSLNKSINSKINIIYLQEEKMAFSQFSYGVANKKIQIFMRIKFIEQSNQQDL